MAAQMTMAGVNPVIVPALPQCTGSEPVAKVGDPFTWSITGVTGTVVGVGLEFRDPNGGSFAQSIGYLKITSITYSGTTINVTGTVTRLIPQRGEGAADILITIIRPQPSLFSDNYPVSPAVCYKDP